MPYLVIFEPLSRKIVIRLICVPGCVYHAIYRTMVIVSNKYQVFCTMSVNSMTPVGGPPIVLHHELPDDTLIVHPEYIDRHTRAALFFGANIINVVLGVMLTLGLLCGGWMLTWGIQRTQMLSTLENGGTSLTARVTGKRALMLNPMAQQYAYALAYEFMEPESGRIINAEQRLPLYLYEGMTIGQNVAIYYHPGTEQVSTLQIAALGTSQDRSALLAGVVGGLLLLLAGVYALPMGVRLWNELCLFGRGECVSASALNAQLSHPQQMPRVTLRYRFRTPAGKECSGEENFPRYPQLRHLPKFGTHLAVIYLDERHFRVL